MRPAWFSFLLLFLCAVPPGLSSLRAEPLTLGAPPSKSRPRGGAPATASSPEVIAYQRHIDEILRRRWTEIGKAEAGKLSVGRVRVHYLVTSPGAVEDVQVLSGAAENSHLAELAVQVLKGATLPPMPPRVLAALPPAAHGTLALVANFGSGSAAAAAVARDGSGVTSAPPGPSSARGFYELGRAHLEQSKDYATAVADFTRAIELDPKFAPAYVQRAFAKDFGGDAAGARADADAAVALAPRYARGYHVRSLLKMGAGDLDGAMSDASQALVLERRFAGGYTARARVRDAQGDYAGAVEDASEAIATDPDFVAGYEVRAHARLAQGDLAAALNDCETSLGRSQALGYANTDARLLHARIERRIGDLTAARADLDRVVALEPKDPAALLARGLLSYDQQAWAEAKTDLTTALRLNPALHVHYRLYLLFSSAHAGAGTETAKAGLREFLARPNPDREGPSPVGEQRAWERELARFALGEIKEEELLARAEAAPPGPADRSAAQRARERESEAVFYTASVRELNGDHDGAAALLRRCAGFELPSSIEVQSARAALLKSSPDGGSNP